MTSRADRFIFRKIRTRKKLFGTSDRPRLSVYRSLNHIYAQVIDDIAGKTLVSASSTEKNFEKESGVNAASKIGQTVGERAVKQGVKSVVFDRGARTYHGRVKAVAEGARKAGLKF